MMTRTGGARLIVAAVALTIGASSSPANAERLSAGLVGLTSVDPVEGGPMSAFVAYPSSGPGGMAQIGPYRIDGARGVPLMARAAAAGIRSDRRGRTLRLPRAVLRGAKGRGAGNLQ
jgi:hypothetical protein